MNQTADSPTRLCPQCFTRRPIDQFRRRRKGSDYRHSQCNSCRTEENRRRAARKRHKAVHSFTQAVNRARSLGAIQGLLNEMARQFGGLENLAQAMMEAREDAKSAGKHHLVLRWWVALIAMLRAAEELKPDPDDFTDEELADFTLDYISDLIRKDPEILFSVARDLGYTVIPPVELEGARKKVGE